MYIAPSVSCIYNSLKYRSFPVNSSAKMAASRNTLIVMGSGPDSFFVGHGRRYFVENMPESFTTHVETNFVICMTKWISMGKSMDTWVVYNMATDNFHFHGINPELRDYICGTNGKFAAGFVSFPDRDDNSPFQYFVKGKKDHWHAVLNNPLSQRIGTVKAEEANFDKELTGILFGKGKTYILMFCAGFLVNFDEETSYEEHPLYKVVQQYNEPGWCIEPQSTLCFYDSRYFFLKLKRLGEDGEVKMHWNLPPAIDVRLRNLIQQTEEPEEKNAVIEGEQMCLELIKTRVAREQAIENQITQQTLMGQQAIMNQVQQMNMMMAASWSNFRLQ
ncbi:hypothetical protein MSAN_01908500 [Mycena sanguinolenta]|uniref:Uncharacterized protein n=1 Tax=Mycena sanguinolenta TaxID=230812 RepID=A0A8H6XQK6_9AGAR|nr:hypothetical protein MSAN_01908500 [Mycena sanguinolenta]